MVIGTFFYNLKIIKIMFANEIMLTSKPQKHVFRDVINLAMQC